MNTGNSLEETQTPKHKVGDVVWIPTPYNINNRGLVFMQTKIIAVVYTRFNSESKFEGYILANERGHSLIEESGVFTTPEELEAFFEQKIKIKSETEDK